MASAGGREVGRISVRVVPDTDNFRRDLKKQLDRIENSERVKIEVDPDLDTASVRTKLKTQLAGIRENVRVGADIDTAGINKQVKDAINLKRDPAFDYRLRQSLQKMGAIKVPVEPDVKTFRTRMSSLLRGLRGNMDSALGGFLGEGKGLRGLGSFADSLALVAVVAAVAAPALALVSGALVSLPAIAAGVVVPIAAIALGLDGIKNAAKSLGAPLGVLKKTMSDTFQTRLTPVFEKLVGPIQSLGSFLPRVANGLSDMAQAFVNTVTSGPGLTKIQNTISSIGESLSRSAPGIASFTDGILGLAEGVARKFPAVADWFNEVGASFSAWVEKVSATGQLDTAITNFGATVKEILGLVGDLAKQGFDFLSDPKFGEKMKTFVADVRTLINELLPQLKTFFEDIADAVAGITASIEKAKAVLPDFNDRPKNNDGSMADTDNIFEPFTSKDAPWRAYWADIKTVAQTVLTEVIGLAAQVPGQLSSAWSSLSGIAAAAWGTVVSTVSSVLAQVVSTVVSAGGQVVTEVGSWPGKIASALAGLYQAGLAAGTQLVQGFINGISGMITTAVAKAKELASSVKNAVTGFLGIHSPSTVMADIGGFIGDGLINGLKSKQGELANVAKDMGQTVKDALDWGDYAQRGIDAGISFAGANADAFMSDFGIGGKGVLSQLVEQGVGFGTQFAGQGLTQIFHTSNVDDTIAVKNNQLNKKALGVVGKSG
ncbi:cation transporter [Mycobacterium sp. NPDC050853]|uniref:phage tail protein n=1 Tax=Mycobacterium sp. NPDC050853 TaxID=3155160 RepID=UPI0033F9AC38